MRKKVVIFNEGRTTDFLLNQKFGRHDLEVIEVSGPQQLIQIANLTTPDVIVLNLHELSASSLSLCKHLKQDLNSRSARVVMLCTDFSSTKIVSAFKAGADYYLANNDQSLPVLQHLLNTVLERRVSNVA